MPSGSIPVYSTRLSGKSSLLDETVAALGQVDRGKGDALAR